MSRFVIGLKQGRYVRLYLLGIYALCHHKVEYYRVKYQTLIKGRTPQSHCHRRRHRNRVYKEAPSGDVQREAKKT